MHRRVVKIVLFLGVYGAPQKNSRTFPVKRSMTMAMRRGRFEALWRPVNRSDCKEMDRIGNGGGDVFDSRPS